MQFVDQTIYMPSIFSNRGQVKHIVPTKEHYRHFHFILNSLFCYRTCPHSKEVRKGRR